MTINICDVKEEEIYRLTERYLVFIDESGDPFVHKDIRIYDDPSISPVMTITALIVAKTVYQEVFVPAVDESKRIQGVLTETKKNGTFYHGPDRFKNISDEILFYTKKDNVNGIQMVDYCTYPFARHAKDANSPDNKLFDLLRRYIHKGDYGEYGLKEWP
jgi:hypothetical protein